LARVWRAPEGELPGLLRRVVQETAKNRFEYCGEEV
jgi:hypothetical protein